MSEPMHIISLGAGVQSSTMALMAAHGEITPMPNCAIFADTGAEPRKVYEWLDWLETKLPFPVHRTMKVPGETGLRGHILRSIEGGDLLLRHFLLNHQTAAAAECFVGSAPTNSRSNRSSSRHVACLASARANGRRSASWLCRGSGYRPTRFPG